MPSRPRLSRRSRIALRWSVALLVLLAIGATVGLALRGDDDEPSQAREVTLTPAVDQSAANRAADLEARNLLRGAFTAAETCFAATGTYARCRSREQLTPFASEAQYGPFLARVVTGEPRPAEIAVTVGTRRELRVISVSRTRNRFAYVRRLPGAPVQSCRTPGFRNPEACDGGRWR